MNLDDWRAAISGRPSERLVGIQRRLHLWRQHMARTPLQTNNADLLAPDGGMASTTWRRWQGYIEAEHGLERTR